MKEQTFESFVSKAAAAHVHLKLDHAEDLSTRRPDALFHLPLLSRVLPASERIAESGSVSELCMSARTGLDAQRGGARSMAWR